MKPTGELLQHEVIHYQDSYMTISMMQDTPLLVFKAKGLPRDSDHFKEEFNYVLNFIFQQSKYHPRIVVFGDLREVQTIIEEDMQYLYEVFIRLSTSRV